MPSSVIRGFRYEAATQTLTITFVSGQRYAYDAVPAAVHEDLIRAPSRGRFFAAHIRARFRHRRLEDEPALRPAARAFPPPAAEARSDG